MKLLLRASLATFLLVSLQAPAVAQDSWSDRISVDGDFRLRYESIDAEGSAGRDRSRVRARLGITAQASDDLKFVFRLATGGDSPVSTNQTLDSGFTTKDIGVDRAYVDWRINDQWSLHAGKIKSPWFKPGGTPLVWDSDLNPEGAAALFKSGNFFGSLAALSVEERSSADDSLLFTAQGGVKLALSEGNTLTTGLSYYSYSNTAGNEPFFNGDPSGNTVDLAGNYVNDYRIIELFAEYKTTLGDWPVTVYADLVQNTEANDQDSAFAIGANFGRASAPGTYQFGYAWHDTEADAVVGTFNDSDFAGGDTDASGHFIKAKYALRENVKLGGTLIISERGEFAGNEQDYDRIMIDLEFSFE